MFWREGWRDKKENIFWSSDKDYLGLGKGGKFGNRQTQKCEYFNTENSKLSTLPYSHSHTMILVMAMKVEHMDLRF